MFAEMKCLVGLSVFDLTGGLTAAMAIQRATPRTRSIAAGLVLAGVVVLALIGLHGPSGALDLILSGLLGVLYVVIPVVVLAVLLLGFFRFNAWRQ